MMSCRSMFLNNVFDFKYFILTLFLLLFSTTAVSSIVELSSEEQRQLAFREPALEYSPGPVTVAVKGGVCFNCGDYFYPEGIENDYLKIYKMDFRSLLKKTIQESGILRNEGKRLTWRATLEQFQGSSTVRAFEERKHSLTAGAVLTINTVVRYELLEGETVLASWLIESSGRSGTLQKWQEASGRAFSRNLRKFFASLKQDLVQDLSPEEKILIARIDNETDGKRSLVGNVFLGLARTGSATGKVVQGTMEVLAAAAPAIEQANNNIQKSQDQHLQQVRAMTAESRRLNDEHIARLKGVDKQRNEQLAQDVRERNTMVAVRQERAHEEAVSAKAKADADQKEADARQLAQREAAERKRLSEEDQRQKEEQRRLADEARKIEVARQKEEKARAEADELLAKQDYLSALTKGTRLVARTCPDGEGKYYIVGTMPKIKPTKVSCVDVHYAVRCEGSTAEQKGIGGNFTGLFTDCFMGDTYEISPKPSCPVGDVRVRATEIRACGT